MVNLYSNNQYWKNNSDYHESDANFKAENSLKLISKININKNSNILDFGCGSGKYLHIISNYLECNFVGIDISEEAILRANKLYKKENINFLVKDIDELSNEKFDLIILNDVIEHIEDYITFIKKIKKKTNYIYFNIPLEINLLSILRNNFVKSYNDVGHLHFFSKDSALQILKHSGLYIIGNQYFFYSKHNLKKNKTFKSLIIFLLISLIKIINKNLCVKLFGNASLGVLVK